MGRQDSELMVTHSSIALLQERFKQLERMKEMREQRELLRLFPESERVSSSCSTMHYKPSRRYYNCNPELSLSPTSSLSFRPEFQHKQIDKGDVKSLLSMNLWPPTTRASNEVDTSLHL